MGVRRRTCRHGAVASGLESEGNRSHFEVEYMLCWSEMLYLASPRQNMQKKVFVGVDKKFPIREKSWHCQKVQLGVCEETHPHLDEHPTSHIDNG